MDRLIFAAPVLSDVMSALHEIPDRSATDIGELVKRVGVDKLTLLQFSRISLPFARLLAAKLANGTDAPKVFTERGTS